LAGVRGVLVVARRIIYLWAKHRVLFEFSAIFLYVSFFSTVLIETETRIIVALGLFKRRFTFSFLIGAMTCLPCTVFAVTGDPIGFLKVICDFEILVIIR
jgi:hypothetical protein